MNKNFMIATLAVLSVSGITPANAATAPTVVIIDSGFDTKITKNVIAEVCVVDASTGCNNGKSLEEGPGASGTNIPILPSWKSEWNHGTIMASIINQINPNANLVLIKDAIVLKSGAINMGGVSDFQLAMKWVIANKTKYNVSAISFSRGSHTLVKNGVCPVNASLQSSIITLQNMGVPTIIAAGNDFDKTYIDYPACIPEAVAISGIYSQNYTPNIFSSYRQTLVTNSGVLTDFYAYGRFNTPAGNVADSTSSSTAAFAGYWSKVSNGNYFETYEKLSKSTSNKYIDVLK